MIQLTQSSASLLIIGLAVLCCPSMAAAAPGQSANSGQSELEEEEAPKPLSITLTLAPTIKRDFEQVRGDNLKDAVSKSSLALGYKWNVSEAIVVQTSTGLDWTSDFEGDDDDEATSAFFAESKVNWDRGCRRISPFSSYRYESGYSDFIDNRGADSGAFAVGADISIYDKDKCSLHLPEEQRKLVSPFKLTASVSVQRIESSDALAERWTPQLRLKSSYRLGSGINLAGELDYQFRAFDEVESGSDRAHRIAAEAGVDFAEFLFGKNPPAVVNTLRLGVSWEMVDYQDTGFLRDKSAFAFTPRISMSRNF